MKKSTIKNTKHQMVLNKCNNSFYEFVQDFVITVVYVIFWFTSSIAWAAGLSGLKKATAVGVNTFKACTNANDCAPVTPATYGALNVSVVSRSSFISYL